MKKIKKLLTIGLVVLLMFCMSVSLVGCRKTREQCIPETMGVTEGLYKYYGNHRSLTDGTEEERLLGEICVDGVTYAEEEYEIQSLEYMQTKKEIFYGLETQKEGYATKHLVWHYNYDTKQSGLLYAFDERESIYNTVVQTSKSYAYVYCYNGGGYSIQGVLFDGDLNLITDEFYSENYRLSGDCVYEIKPFGEFHWWKNGQFGVVETVSQNDVETVITENYAYLIYENETFLIDLNTGEHISYTFKGDEKVHDCTVRYQTYYSLGEDSCYVITSSQTTLTDNEYLPLKTGCKLYRLQGLEITCAYTFEPSYQASIKSFDERYLNLEIKRLILNYKTDEHSAYYDLQTGAFVKGKSQIVQTIYTKHKRLTVGEYEFYTSSVECGGGVLWAPDFCYYLHRVTNGKDEIMQYCFVPYNGTPYSILFDDIYEK